MNARNQVNDVRSKLVSDLKSVIDDARDLLRNTGQQVDEGYQSARSRFESTLQNAASGLHSLEDSAASKAKDTMKSADQYVHDHPWQSVGIGALAGLIFGIVIGRK